MDCIKRRVIGFFCCFLTLLLLASHIYSYNEKPVSYHVSSITLKAKQAIVIDFNTSKILLEKNSREKIHPSSMTKIMTSYIIEEEIKKGNASMNSSYIVTENAWKMRGTKSFMPIGGLVKLQDILRGIIIQSGNDACIVAAEGLYNSEENFTKIMNYKAQEIGMLNTHFSNSSGWPESNHYSTVYDISLLSAALIRDHPEFYNMYSEKSFTFGKDKFGQPITQGNRNPLLYKNINCDGIKTGATEAGGYSLAASFVHEDRRYIFVISGLRSMQERADEAMKIVNWIKQNFLNKKLYSKGDYVGDVFVSNGTKDKVKLKVDQDFSILTFHTTQNDIDLEKRFFRNMLAPLKIGDNAGEIIIKYENDFYKIPVLVSENIAEINIIKRIGNYLSKFIKCNKQTDSITH